MQFRPQCYKTILNSDVDNGARGAWLTRRTASSASGAGKRVSGSSQTWIALLFAHLKVKQIPTHPGLPSRELRGVCQWASRLQPRSLKQLRHEGRS